MRSSRTRDFRQRFAELPPRIKETAKKNYELWKLNPLHPSLEFKEVKPKRTFGQSELESDGERWE